jgi:HEPN domain-containing protein
MDETTGQAPNLPPPLEQLERLHRRMLRRAQGLDLMAEQHRQLAMAHLERQDYSAAATEAHRAHQSSLRANLLRELMLP